MSGGSYNYLCYAKDEDIFTYSCQHSLKKIYNDFAKLGYADDIAKETFELLSEIKASQNRISTIKERLDPVFKAMEWWKSSDWNEETFKNVLKEYRKNKIQKENKND